MSYQYLKNEQHYIDRYDLITIEACLNVIDLYRKTYQETAKSEELKHLSDEDREKDLQKLLSVHLYATRADYYKRKKAAIAEWVERDRLEQNAYDNTPEPKGVTCPSCETVMSCTMRDLQSYHKEPLRVLFFFECPSCKKRKGIYDNSEELVSKPDLCPKCNKEIKTTITRDDEVLTWVTTCSSCGFTETKVDDWKAGRLEREKREQEEKDLLTQYRDEFCLTDEKGEEALNHIEAMEVASAIREETRQKYNSQTYTRTLELKKLGIVELEQLITDPAEEAHFVKFSLDKPEIGRYVIVPFTAQDADSSRKGHNSTKAFEAVLKPLLEDTNWRVVSNSLSYRLGYVSGQLKGYESEEDMWQLAGKKKEKPVSKIDPQKRRKHEGNNLVQLARLLGEQDGIQDARKKRLEKEPDGFFLNGEGPYTCAICQETAPGDKIWWTAEAMRCADCWRNVKEGVIPPLAYRDEAKWIPDWRIKHDYRVHSATQKKLIREGLLKPRELKREDGKVYCRIYLIEENQEFLEKYPKNPEYTLEVRWSEDGNLTIGQKKDSAPDPHANEVLGPNGEIIKL